MMMDFLKEKVLLLSLRTGDGVGSRLSCSYVPNETNNATTTATIPYIKVTSETI